MATKLLSSALRHEGLPAVRTLQLDQLSVLLFQVPLYDSSVRLRVSFLEPLAVPYEDLGVSLSVRCPATPYRTVIAVAPFRLKLLSAKGTSRNASIVRLSHLKMPLGQ